MILSLIAFLTIYFIFKIFDISVKGDVLDTFLLCITYFVFSNIIFWILLVRSKIIKISVLIIGLFPILIGYVLSTIGLLGLMMILGDYEVKEKKILTNNIQYRKYGFGNATTSDGGYEFDFYKTYKFSPFEKRIAQIKMDFREYKMENLNVEFNEIDDFYKIQIKSKEQIQIDTLIKK